MTEYLKTALECDLMEFISKIGENDNRGNVLTSAGALVLLLREVRAGGPDAAVCADRAAEHLIHLAEDGSRWPFFSLCPYWCYCNLTAAVALARHTEAVWGRLDKETVEKYDFIMATFARILAFGTSDQNNYLSGPGMTGNYCKDWNPNYRLANVPPMVFASAYFGGADEIDAILASFSYDETVAAFKKYGCARAIAEWTAEPPTLADGTRGATPKEFLENGGPLHLRDSGDDTAKRLGIFSGKPGGGGEGVRVKYIYKGHRLTDPAGIMGELLDFCYSGGPIVSTYGTYEDGRPMAYILDGTKSPYEGKDGMMKEFASGDGGGIRSSHTYCSHNFVMIAAALCALDELGIYRLERDAGPLSDRVRYGTADVLYKGEHGYMSYSLAHNYETKETPSCGYLMWKGYWQERYSVG